MCCTGPRSASSATVDAPAYDDLAREQVDLARGRGDAEEDLQAMINGGDTWLVG